MTEQFVIGAILVGGPGAAIMISQIYAIASRFRRFRRQGCHAGEAWQKACAWEG